MRILQEETQLTQPGIKQNIGRFKYELWLPGRLLINPRQNTDYSN